jgi:CheY-like chemotaxis protein
MSITGRTLNEQHKALVVEDDPATLDLLQEILISEGFDVVSAMEGEEAETRILQQQFHGIFLDLNVPGLDGLQLARRVRGSMTNRSTLVVIITASEDRRAMESAFAAGASLFLSKPIDRRRLLSLLRMVRERSQPRSPASAYLERIRKKFR